MVEVLRGPRRNWREGEIDALELQLAILGDWLDTCAEVEAMLGDEEAAGHAARVLAASLRAACNSRRQRSSILQLDLALAEGGGARMRTAAKWRLLRREPDVPALPPSPEILRGLAGALLDLSNDALVLAERLAAQHDVLAREADLCLDEEVV